MYINKKQLLYFFIIFVCLFFVLILPSLLHLQSPAEKQVVMEHNNVVSQSATVTSIFNNNLIIAGISLVPYVGWGWLLTVMWATGSVAASYSQPWYWLLANPFAYVELTVYSYIILRSIKLVHLFKQRKTRFTDLDGKEVVRKTTGVYPEMVKTVAYAFIVSSVVLICSALVEFLLIRGLL